MAVFTYPSDDLSSYGVGSDSPLLQLALGDLRPSVGAPPYFPGLRVPRRTIWKYALDDGQFTVAIMCSPADVNFIAGSGTIISVAGIEYTLVAAYGEDRNPQGPYT